MIGLNWIISACSQPGIKNLLTWLGREPDISSECWYHGVSVYPCSWKKKQLGKHRTDRKLTN